MSRGPIPSEGKDVNACLGIIGGGVKEINRKSGGRELELGRYPRIAPARCKVSRNCGAARTARKRRISAIRSASRRRRVSRLNQGAFRGSHVLQWNSRGLDKTTSPRHL